MKLRLGWKDGLKTPIDECKFMMARSYALYNDREKEQILNKMIALPPNFTGFIPDTYFHSAKLREVPEENREEFEIKDAIEYVGKMQSSMPLNSIMDFSTARGYLKRFFIVRYLLELLSRNRNVDLLLSDEHYKLLLETLVDNNIIEVKKRRSSCEMFKYILEKCLCDADDEMYNIVSSIEKKDGVLSIEFNTKQGVHQFVGYPRY